MGNAIRLQQVRSLACDMQAAVSAFLSYSESKNLSGETLTFYKYRLRCFTDFAPDMTPQDVTPSTMRDFMLHAREKHSPMTANHCLQVLKTFFSWLESEGYTESNPAESVEKQKVHKPVIETFSGEQVQAVLSTCRKDFYGIRDRAILLTLLDTGLRVSELCGITLEDVCWNEQTIRIIGKGDKERIVPFGQGVRQALTAYLTARGEQGTSSLFVGHYGEALDRYRVREVVKKRCDAAGIKGLRPSPHTLRHTAAVSYLRAGGDTFTLQKLLGHASQDMTKRYCESLSAADVQKKHRQFSPVDNLKLPAPTSGRRRLK